MGIHATMVSLDESMVSIGTAFLVMSLVGLSLFHILNIKIEITFFYICNMGKT